MPGTKPVTQTEWGYMLLSARMAGPAADGELVLGKRLQAYCKCSVFLLLDAKPISKKLCPS